MFFGVEGMARNGRDRVGENRRKFRAILKRKKMTPMPGGFSPLYALLAQEAGFECFFLPGSQLSHFLYGVPDNGIIGLRDLVDHPLRRRGDAERGPGGAEEIRHGGRPAADLGR